MGVWGVRCGVCHVAQPPDAHRFIDGEHERAARAQPFVLPERRQAVVAAEEVEQQLHRRVVRQTPAAL